MTAECDHCGKTFGAPVGLPRIWLPPMPGMRSGFDVG